MAFTVPAFHRPVGFTHRATPHCNALRREPARVRNKTPPEPRACFNLTLRRPQGKDAHCCNRLATVLLNYRTEGIPKS